MCKFLGLCVSLTFLSQFIKGDDVSVKFIHTFTLALVFYGPPFYLGKKSVCTHISFIQICSSLKKKKHHDIEEADSNSYLRIYISRVLFTLVPSKTIKKYVHKKHHNKLRLRQLNAKLEILLSSEISGYHSFYQIVSFYVCCMILEQFNVSVVLLFDLLLLLMRFPWFWFVTKICFSLYHCMTIEQ